MTNDTHNLDTQWQRSGVADPYPDLPAPAMAVTPWTSDAELVERVADLVDVYPGADRGVLLGQLRDLRRHLREAVMAEAAASVLDGLVDLVHAATTDEELALLVAGAEAVRGVEVPGLLAALDELREAAACGVTNAAA